MSRQIWSPQYDTLEATGAIRRGQALKLAPNANTVMAVNNPSDLVFAISAEDAPNGGTIDAFREFGEAIFLAGGNIATGNRLKIDAMGRVILATGGGEESIGVALSAGTENSLVRGIFTRTTIGTTFTPSSTQSVLIGEVNLTPGSLNALELYDTGFDIPMDREWILFKEPGKAMTWRARIADFLAQSSHDIGDTITNEETFIVGLGSNFFLARNSANRILAGALLVGQFGASSITFTLRKE